MNFNPPASNTKPAILVLTRDRQALDIAFYPRPPVEIFIAFAYDYALLIMAATDSRRAIPLSTISSYKFSAIQVDAVFLQG